MQAQTPATISTQYQLNNSVNQVLSGNVSPGNGLTFDAQGIPETYSTDNMTGIIIRIAQSANPFGLPIAWPATINTPVTFAHNLNKVPYGFIIINITGEGNVYWKPDVNPPTLIDITLYCTASDIDVTVWILV